MWIIIQLYKITTYFTTHFSICYYSIRICYCTLKQGIWGCNLSLNIRGIYCLHIYAEVIVYSIAVHHFSCIMAHCSVLSETIRYYIVVLPIYYTMIAIKSLLCELGSIRTILLNRRIIPKQYIFTSKSSLIIHQ